MSNSQKVASQLELSMTSPIEGCYMRTNFFHSTTGRHSDSKKDNQQQAEYACKPSVFGLHVCLRFSIFRKETEITREISAIVPIIFLLRKNCKGFLEYCAFISF